MHRLRLLAASVAFLSLIGQPAVATAQRAMTIVDLLNVPALSDAQLSPDGRQVLYVQAAADWAANKRISHIWRVNRDGSGSVLLTSGEHGETAPRWSPDGASIVFVARRGGDDEPQLYVLPNAGGEARRLTTHPAAVSSPAWSPDGHTIYFVAPDPKTDAQKAKDEVKDDVYAFDEDYRQRHLWRVSVTTGETARITSGDFSVLSFTLSRDGSRIAFHRGPNPLFGYSDRSEVWVMASDGSSPRELTRNTVAEAGATLSPDNTRVLFVAGANDRFETYYDDNIFVVPAAGGPARILTASLQHEVEAAEWSKDGRSIYFIVNMGVHSELFVMSADGGPARQITDGRHALRAWAYEPAADVHVFSRHEPDNAGDIWALAAEGAPARVTRVFEYLGRDFKLPRQERVEWKGADGVRVEGLVFYPLDYKAGQRYPLVVQTHGGPQASDKFGFGNWQNYVQVLTAMGYVVLQPNYRGGTGYGDAFMRDMVGHYFANSHLDVMAGVDHLIALGIADGDRMAKMGWSGGGHMTNKIITFTNRFKAAASGAGAANWISMYAQSDTRVYRTPWFGGTPWQKNAPIDTYWAHSPLKDIANVTTPTIFLVGEQDVRVPMAQSVEMYRGLLSNGVPTHLYAAPREPHVWQELRHELFKVNVELDWFEKWVTKRSYTWEKAPER